MKDKASWILVVVALIGAISANIQTLLNNAGERADQANNNVKVIVNSIQEQLKFSDKQMSELTGKMSQFNAEMEHQSGEIHELRTMMFSISSRRSPRVTVEPETSDVFSSDEEVSHSRVPASTYSEEAAKELRTAAPSLTLKTAKRPSWPPAQLSFN